MHASDSQLASQSSAHEVPQRVEVAGHEMTVFVESPALVEAMVEDIRAASKRVWLESYIFANDAAGRAVAEALADRAGAGVDVRLMVDAWGSFSTPAAMFNRMRAAGVRIHLFHALREALFGRFKFLHVINRRNHRKLLVVDERIAYFGGMNVVDQSRIHSRQDALARKLPSSAGWRDVHVRLIGPRAAEIGQACERLWNRVHHQRSGRQSPWPIAEMLRAPQGAMFFFDSRPSFKARRPARVLVPLIRQARHDITLAVAYFAPVGRVLRELVKARRRGVRVQVILPGQSDVRVVQWAARHYYEFLLKRGIRVYERNDRMMHSKVMLIDGVCSVVGSCNLDARSLLDNLEFFAVIRSPQLAAALARICREEIEQSVRVDAAYCRGRSCWQRQVDRLAWGLRRYL